MNTPLEHDYIGLSEASSSMEKRRSEKKNSSGLNMKETELRLGLPGSESPPERKSGAGVSLFGKGLEEKTNGYMGGGAVKNFGSAGAKRGFSDAIDGSGKWVFSVNGLGSEVDSLGKSGCLFSPPRGGLETKNIHKCVKESGGGGGGGGVVGVPSSPKPVKDKKTQDEHGSAPAAKAQVVGWPPIRSFRKNTMSSNNNSTKNRGDDVEANSGSECLYVKVSMDGAPYLRKVDLRTCTNYVQLSSALEKMFSCFTIGQCASHGLPGRDGLSESRLMDLLHGSEYVLTYEDKDGDWMLVGDVPWAMFTDSCKRLRIMKGSDAIGLAPRAMEKCKNRN